MHDKDVCKIARATPGLLNTSLGCIPYTKCGAIIIGLDILKI